MYCRRARSPALSLPIHLSEAIVEAANETPSVRVQPPVSKGGEEGVMGVLQAPGRVMGVGVLRGRGAFDES
jgi:hypothetical protein